MKIIKTYKEECSFESPFFNEQKGYHYLIEVEKGGYIETGVYLHYLNEIKKAVAIDVSCMIGCPEKCIFCSSSNFKYIRSLTSKELVEEVQLVLQRHQYIDFNEIVISFQGIGEPSLVPDRIAHAIGLLLKMLPEKTTISIATTGINLNAFTVWKNSGIQWKNLQISITNYSILNFCKIQKLVNYIENINVSDTFSRIKFNYILIEGLNDSDDHLNKLISVFANTLYIVKLSKLNNCNINKKLVSSSMERFRYFNEELKKHKIISYIFGANINSKISCGQLVYLNSK